MSVKDGDVRRDQPQFRLHLACLDQLDHGGSLFHSIVKTQIASSPPSSYDSTTRREAVSDCVLAKPGRYAFGWSGLQHAANLDDGDDGDRHP